MSTPYPYSKIAVVQAHAHSLPVRLINRCLLSKATVSNTSKYTPGSLTHRCFDVPRQTLVNVSVGIIRATDLLASPPS